MEYKKILSYLGIPYEVYKIKSKYNGNITVVSIFGQYSISVASLTQTGPIVEGLWKTALERFKIYDLRFKNILVLGVGGGSIIKVLRNKYPKAAITGIEIDKEMINIGRKYFNLDIYNANIKIQDAFTFVKKDKVKYDLILIDLLIGRNIPKKLSSEEFFQNCKKLLNKKGTIIINRLRLKGSKNNNLLLPILRKTYASVEVKRPLVNELVYCRN